MTRKDSFFFILIEVLCILNALVSFRVFENGFTAAVAASSGFVVGVGYIYWRSRQFPKKRRHGSYWLSLINFYLTCLPLFIIRLMTPEDERIGNILGMNGAQFHKVAEWLFVVLVVATIIDTIRVLRTRKA